MEKHVEVFQILEILIYKWKYSIRASKAYLKAAVLTLQDFKIRQKISRLVPMGVSQPLTKSKHSNSNRKMYFIYV